jgi:hypothetical protein
VGEPPPDHLPPVILPRPPFVLTRPAGDKIYLTGTGQDDPDNLERVIVPLEGTGMFAGMTGARTENPGKPVRPAKDGIMYSIGKRDIPYKLPRRNAVGAELLGRGFAS